MNTALVSLLSLSMLLGFGSGLRAVESETINEVVRAQDPSSEQAEEKAPAWRPDKPSEILVMVQAFYDGTADLEAKFTQKYWNPAYNEARNTSGKLKLKKPGTDEAVTVTFENDKIVIDDPKMGPLTFRRVK